MKITKQDKRIVVSQAGIEIRREGKAVSFESIQAGFVYLVVDCSWSMAGDKLSQAKIRREARSEASKLTI